MQPLQLSPPFSVVCRRRPLPRPSGGVGRASGSSWLFGFLPLTRGVSMVGLLPSSFASALYVGRAVGPAMQAVHADQLPGSNVNDIVRPSSCPGGFLACVRDAFDFDEAMIGIGGDAYPTEVVGP